MEGSENVMLTIQIPGRIVATIKDYTFYFDIFPLIYGNKPDGL